MGWTISVSNIFISYHICCVAAGEPGFSKQTLYYFGNFGSWTIGKIIVKYSDDDVIIALDAWQNMANCFIEAASYPISPRSDLGHLFRYHHGNSRATAALIFDAANTSLLEAALLPLGVDITQAAVSMEAQLFF